MQINIKSGGVLIALFFSSLFLNGQLIKKLTLEEAITLGLQNSKQLRISSGKIEAMQARVAQIKNLLIPSLNVNLNYTRISDNIEPFKVKFSASAPETALNPQILDQSYNRLGLQYGLFTGFRAINSLKSAQYLEKASELDAEKDKKEIKLNIINAYYNVYKLISSKSVLDDNLKTLDNRLENTKAFAAQGIALKNDVMKLELTKANLQQNLADLQSAIDISNFNLDLMLGLPTETKLELEMATTVRASANPMVTSNELMAEAINNRSEIKANLYRKMANEHAIKMSRGNYYPVVSIGANYDYNLPNQRVFPSQDAFKGTWLAGITATYNLVNLYSAKALVREQKANYIQTINLNEQIEDAVKMEVNANSSGYQTALQKISLAEKSINQAKENQRIMQTRYTNQIATLTDMLEADALYSQAQLNLVNAKADAEIAFAKLQKSLGN